MNLLASYAPLPQALNGFVGLPNQTPFRDSIWPKKPLVAALPLKSVLSTLAVRN